MLFEQIPAYLEFFGLPTTTPEELRELSPAAARPEPIQRTPRKARTMPMKTSIATVSISGDLSEKLAAIAAAGFDGVEIFEADLLAYDATPARGRRAWSATPGSSSRSSSRSATSRACPSRSARAAFDRAERKFDADGRARRRPDPGLLEHLAGLARRHRPRRRRPARARRARGSPRHPHRLRGAGLGPPRQRPPRRLGDRPPRRPPGGRADPRQLPHARRAASTRDSIRSIPGDKLFLVQLADAPAFKMDLLQWSRHYRNMPGEGDLPVKAFLAAVAATGYDGWLSLEIFNDQFRGGSPRSISVDGHRSLVYLMDQVRRDEPRPPDSSPPMPDRIAVSGVEFVEFAATRKPPRRWSASSTAWASARPGRHVSKDVTLYRQGGINLVVNTEREGLAHPAYLTHGVGVCDIGLRVEDAAATVERAAALGAQIFEQRRGPGELAIPAIRGVGGSLMHFIDQSPELVAGLGDRVRRRPRTSAGRRRRADARSTMSPRPCPSTRCCRGCCSTPRSSAPRRRRASTSSTPRASSAARRSRTPTAACA